MRWLIIACFFCFLINSGCSQKPLLPSALDVVAGATAGFERTGARTAARFATAGFALPCASTNSFFSQKPSYIATDETRVASDGTKPTRTRAIASGALSAEAATKTSDSIG